MNKKDMITSRVLLGLSRMDKVFSNRRRLRFLNSARKRNPNIVLPNLSFDRRGFDRFVDAEWFMSKHGLSASADLNKHYSQISQHDFYSPHPALAFLDGVTLSQWGAEFLLRSGFEIGVTSNVPLSPNDTEVKNPFSIVNNHRKRIAVVTGIFGDFDRLLPIDPCWKDNADFYLFSDRKFANPGNWTQLHCNYDHHDPRRRARFIKTHLPTYFSSYDWVFWVDGNIMLCVDPKYMVQILEQSDSYFFSFKHPHRANVIHEAVACLKLGKDDFDVLSKHISQNISRPGMRAPLLFETGVSIMKPHDADVRKMCVLWWEAIMLGSKRDQLSLPLAVIETPNLKYSFLPDSLEKSVWFAKSGHK